jgi:hypothetical protein
LHQCINSSKSERFEIQTYLANGVQVVQDGLVELHEDNVFLDAIGEGGVGGSGRVSLNDDQEFLALALLLKVGSLN